MHRILSLFLILSCSFLFSQQEITILSSGVNSLTFKFEPQNFSFDTISIGTNNFIRISFSGAVFPNAEKFGDYSIPYKNINIGVPAEYGNNFSIVDYNYYEIEGVIETSPLIKKSGEREYSSDSPKEFQNEILKLGEYGIIRGLSVQALLISPVEVFPNERKIRIYTSLIVQVNFKPNQKNNINVYDDFLSNIVINYNTARVWIEQPAALSKINSSELANGKWVRFEAPTEGIYRITRSQFASWGFDPASTDPKTIKIFNNGGYVLPESNSANYPDGLTENAILVIGEDDGVFDNDDYILFYGRGTDFWFYDSLQNRVRRNYHPYSKENYYWITAGGSNGKRISSKVSLNSSIASIQESSRAFYFFEEDKINIGKTGRYFLGDEFSESIKTRTYNKKLDGFIPGSTFYRYRFVNASSESVNFKLEENGIQILNRNLSGYGTDEYTYGIADSFTVNFNQDLPDSRSILKITFNATTSSARGYLDFYEILYNRDLKYYSEDFTFFSNQRNQTIEYRLSNFPTSNILVFDVSDHSNVRIITNPILQSGGEYRFQVEEGNKFSKYFALSNSNFKSPVNPTSVSNQDIRGDVSGAKFIIITHKDFIEQANRLRNYRETSGLTPISTKVLLIDQILNEFSCGMTDPSGLRNFIKYAYTNWNIKPDYVLLFGDGNYDFKNIEGANKNFILTYQTDITWHEIDSYTSDDYFVSVVGNDMQPELAIARLPVNNLSEAKIVVDKIIKYESDTNPGLWKNTITLVADDGKTSKGDDGAEHTNHSESLSKNKIPKSFDQKKIYLAAYPTVQTGLGRRKPDVNKAIIDAVNEGTLILSYIGHGSPELWAHEQVFVQNTTIPQLVNDKLFFLSAATCDFAYFDKIGSQSSTEQLVLKDKSAAIGVFSAVRPVYSIQNALLNEELFSRLLNSPIQSDGFNITFGKAYYETKYRYYLRNDQKYHFFGDPTLRLQIPRYNATIDSINGVDISNSSPIQIKALSRVTLFGTIRLADSSVWSNFSGEGLLTVFDSERSIALPELSASASMQIQGGIIFRGRVSVVNGKFNATFVVPKDISYDNKNGKIVFYFYDDNNDGIGYTNNIIIGGTDQTIVNDGKGPEISIAFDNVNNINGLLVTPSSKILISLHDETGLNTTGVGVGHKLEIIVNGDETNPIDLTNYFTGDKDADGKSGIVEYPLNAFKDGKYNITVKAWDVFNNFSSADAEFEVLTSNNLEMNYVYNYPNPFSSNTIFTFQYNLDSPINIKINIYTIAGRLVKVIEEKNIYGDRFVKIPWDGRDEDGDLLANGVYLYKISINNNDGKLQQSVLGKLSIIR